ncbi:hypothetical protein LCI18_010093 [Fusarium solani-melongenae]|uniref:Uncharacterized protein n=1 Tax=Fusarium solani subsp. cucurbitae TaxID=2747967 RepID=A0ACD3ZCZ1_FUSSC|nr:hypothetical protein LCI18_010093 [Fusarium solani-melongenae]
MSQPESLYLPPSPPSSVKMDPAATDGSCDNMNSPPARSTAGSQVSLTGGQFINSNISASPQSLPLESSRQPPISSPNSYSSTAYLSSSAAESSYLPTPASQPYSPFPVLTPAGLNSSWSQTDQLQSDSTSSLRQQQGRTSLQSLTSDSRQTERSSDMSTVALQFDPAFSMGPRSAFTWPGPLESNASGNSMMSTGLSSMGPVSGTSLSPPPQSRSLTSSPPRLSLTTDQREIKRHQDKARRDTRLVSRMRRASSNSYVDSPPPAMGLPSATTAMNLPAYTTSPAPVTLMSEPATTMGGSTYLQSYSPATMEDQQAQSASVYPTAYPQNLQANYNMPVDYAAVYAGPGHYSTRPTSIPVGQDVGFMYQVPAVMGSGSTSSHEGGHVRVVQSRPKPRCWEHGCNGRQFSTFSNLLRHQREKSGQAAKATCPNCGAEFTRTTARNGHLLHDKCKGRRNT